MEFVTVGCKLPHGLVIGEGEKQVKLEGALSTLIFDANDRPLNKGFGITENVPKETWEQFLSAFKDSDVIKSGFVFAHKDVRSVKSEAREKEKEETGFEGINPDGDKRTPRNISKVKDKES